MTCVWLKVIYVFVDCVPRLATLQSTTRCSVLGRPVPFLGAACRMWSDHIPHSDSRWLLCMTIIINDISQWQHDCDRDTWNHGYCTALWQDYPEEEVLYIVHVISFPLIVGQFLLNCWADVRPLHDQTINLNSKVIYFLKWVVETQHPVW